MMGARMTFGRLIGLPMTVDGGALHSFAWLNVTSSAQVKSAMLLAGRRRGAGDDHAPRPSRDHTERFLDAFGAPVVHEAMG